MKSDERVIELYGATFWRGIYRISLSLGLAVAEVLGGTS